MTHQEITEEQGTSRDDSEDLDAFGLDVKLRILKYLQTERSIRTDPGGLAIYQDLVVLLKHVVDWASFLLISCREVNKVAEPRGQGHALQARSKLHQGFFDWIFVKPNRPFVKR